MPELPEVETFRRNIEKKLKGKTITNVIVHPDKVIYGLRSPAYVKKAFLGAKIKKCGRKGKYIWFETSKKPWPVFHLGMTGSYVLADELPDAKLKSVKLVLETSDGNFLIFKDPRRFGRIFLLDDPLHSPPLSNLGPDVAHELPSPQELFDLLHHRNSPIKALLMDQSLLSGIGNWMADEILFQSRISPLRKASELKRAEFTKLRQKIDAVTKLAVKVGADDKKYPKSWLFHHRWGKKGVSISSGEDIRFTEVGGRTTAWVPDIQK